MRYRVHGISRATGKETTLLVNAKHHEAAHAIASRQLLVSEVLPEGGLAVPEVFDPRALDPAPEVPLANPVQAHPRTPSRPRRVVLIVIVLAILGVVGVCVFLSRGAG